MFSRLLVPLDGSSLAEAILPPVITLARALDAQVTLLHVVERNAPQTIHGDTHLTTSTAAERYLGTLADRLRAEGIAARAHVHDVAQGDVAACIVAHGDEFRPDLIMLSTHGRGGLRSFLFGSIAQQVLAQQRVPVFLVRPHGDRRDAEPFRCRQILVPLDGDARHAIALEVAADLARMVQARLIAAHVVPTRGDLAGDHAATGMLMPRAMSAVLDLSESGAATYLDERLQAVRAPDLEAQAVVQRGDPATIIGALATHSDLVVLATHARHGMDAFWEGSVGWRVMDSCAYPLLLVRAL